MSDCDVMGFSAKCSLYEVVKDHAESSKLNVTDLRLILLDHITIVLRNNEKIETNKQTHPAILIQHY